MSKEGKPTPSPPSVAESARVAIEKIIADGAVAILIVYEDRNRHLAAAVIPPLESVRLGLLAWAAAPDGD